MTKLINEKGAEIEYGDIPDCRLVYIWLKHHAPDISRGGTTLTDMVIDCWHQAIDYKAVALGTGEARLLVDGEATLALMAEQGAKTKETVYRGVIKKWRDQHSGKALPPGFTFEIIDDRRAELASIARGLTDQLIYNEMFRLSELMECGATDASSPKPDDEFAALKEGYPEIYKRVAQAFYEKQYDL